MLPCMYVCTMGSGGRKKQAGHGISLVSQGAECRWSHQQPFTPRYWTSSLPCLPPGGSNLLTCAPCSNSYLRNHTKSKDLCLQRPSKFQTSLASRFHYSFSFTTPTSRIHSDTDYPLNTSLSSATLSPCCAADGMIWVTATSWTSSSTSSSSSSCSCLVSATALMATC